MSDQTTKAMTDEELEAIRKRVEHRRPFYDAPHLQDRKNLLAEVDRLHTESRENLVGWAKASAELEKLMYLVTLADAWLNEDGLMDAIDGMTRPSEAREAFRAARGWK